MTEEKFITMMIDMMDTECDLKMDMELNMVEDWDSLSQVSFLGICASKYNLTIQPETIKSAKTIGDLYRLIKDEDSF